MDAELKLVVTEWSSEQLTNYIQRLEERVMGTNALIKELKLLRRKKFRVRKPLDTGAPRGGK